MTSRFFIFASLLFTLSSACVELYGQCGGDGYTGPTCCIQPTPLPGYVSFIPDDSVICKTFNPAYSQCVPRCSANAPCLVLPTRQCITSFLGTDGRGRQYCGPQTACTNPEWCFSDPSSCVCGGGVPCALTSRPGGCRALNEQPVDGEDPCFPGARRCPAFENEQCGGEGHVAPSSCQPGLTCVRKSEQYSVCERI